MGILKRIFIVLVLAVLVSSGFVGYSAAACVTGEQSCSSNYAVGQIFFGSGGSLDTTCSTTYCAKQSVGEITVGNTSDGSKYQAQAGFNVDRQPSLTFIVNTASVNMGVLSSTTTATGTASFSVKSYLSSGYSVITESQPPQNGSYTMKALSAPTASSAGTEQFGINLVANTTGGSCNAPANFGANPLQVPSTSFSYGVAASGYNTCGLFQYIPGSIIASSSESSGETDYTISYIMNISPVTPGGQYSMNQILVATPTF